MAAARLTIATTAAALLLGCTSPSTITPGAESYTVVGPDSEIEVDAYLYDARLHRDGKPTSFRLQIFQSEDELAMSGRGYLGKGALKASLKDDTLLAWFPSTNEYVHESVASLFSSTDCPESIVAPRLEPVLAALPSQELFPGTSIDTVKAEEKEREFLVGWSGCSWSMALEYDLRDEGWRLKEMEFEAGENVRLTLKRRVYKPQTEIKRSKTAFRVPDDAVRISP